LRGNAPAVTAHRSSQALPLGDLFRRPVAAIKRQTRLAIEGNLTIITTSKPDRR
jgi:hypothetical protein